MKFLRQIRGAFGPGEADNGGAGSASPPEQPQAKPAATPQPRAPVTVGELERAVNAAFDKAVQTNDEAYLRRNRSADRKTQQCGGDVRGGDLHQPDGGAPVPPLVPFLLQRPGRRSAAAAVLPGRLVSDANFRYAAKLR